MVGARDEKNDESAPAKGSHKDFYESRRKIEQYFEQCEVEYVDAAGILGDLLTLYDDNVARCKMNVKHTKITSFFKKTE